MSTCTVASACAVVPICLAMLVGVSGAATYHVSQNHPGAADVNPGTAEQPFKTISAAVKLLKAGDTALVHAGVYREQVEFKPQGEDWTRPVVVAAAPGEEVVIKGSDVVTGWEKHQGHIWKKTDWKVNSQLVMVNGENLQQIAGEMPKMLMEYWRGKVGEGLADMKPGSFFMDTKTKTLHLWLKNNGDPNAAMVEVGVRPHLLWAEGRYFVIKGFKMTQTSTSHRVNWPGVILKGEHVVFQDNEVTWCDFVGFGMDGSFIDVIGNKFNHCGNSGIGGNSRFGCRLIGNETSYNNWRRWSSGWHAGGVKLIPIERHLLIHRHKAFRNIASDGIWIDSYDSSNITVSNCESAYNDGSGLHYEIAQRGVIINNLFHQNRGRGIYLSSASETLVAHNVAYGNGMSGIVSHGANRPGPVERFGPEGIVWARNNRILGNIMADNMDPELKPKGWEYRPEVILPNPENNPALFGGCVSDYNVFWRSDGRKIPFWFNWGEKVWHSLETWQQATANDRHSVIADPLFMDPKNGDFRLKPGSPAAGRVPILGDVGEDADGKERARKDAYRTAGAYELVAPPTPARPPAAQPATPKPPASRPSSGRLAVPPPQTLKLQEVPLPASAALLADGVLPHLRGLAPLLSGKEITADGVRMVMADKPAAVILGHAHSSAALPVNLTARTLYFLVAVVGHGAGAGAECQIVRGDGITQTVSLELGRNVGPSFGPWAGPLDPTASPPYAASSLAWQGALPDGTAARLWLITYVNDNEWLPVQQVKWTLKQPQASVAVLKLMAGLAKN